MTTDRSEWPLLAASDEVQAKIRSTKLLVVGAGGIGCELLKTLVLSGFRDIKVIDLDMIDTSNLNRQFLFRKKHVGQSKASIAAAAVKAFCPDAKIEPFCDNVKNPKYNREFFSGFDVVLNGLDNLEARRHVNRLCLAAEKPLVESGTEGYTGQVSVHIPKKFQCFECTTKDPPKSFPVCTIRNTPEKPIHCIVWAKELLFQRLFGKVDAVTDLDEEGEEEGKETETVDFSTFLRKAGESVTEYAARVFTRVFQLDIERLLLLDDLWKNRAKPKALVLAELCDGAVHKDFPEGTEPTASKLQGLADQHKVWSVEENARVFLEAVRLYHDTRPDELGASEFDKDDPLAVDFVTAASNLRSIAYGIPPQSAFDAKGMAGNIIHAIATTNAIISGMMTVEAIKLVAGLPDLARISYLMKFPNYQKVVYSSPCDKPNPKCPVCSHALLHLSINTKETTFKHLISKVLKERLSMIAPSVRTDGGLGYEEGDDLEDDEREMYNSMLPKALVDLPGGGITADTVLEVDDFDQELQMKIVVHHKDDWDEKGDPDAFKLTGDIPVPESKAPEAEDVASGKRPPDEGSEPPSKRAKVASPTNDDDDDVVLVDDGDFICLE